MIHRRVVLMSMLLHSSPISLRKISSQLTTKTKTRRRADSRRPARVITTLARASIHKEECNSFTRDSRITKELAAHPQCRIRFNKRSHLIRAICPLVSSSQSHSSIISSHSSSQCRHRLSSPCPSSTRTSPIRAA